MRIFLKNMGVLFKGGKGIRNSSLQKMESRC